MASLLVCLPPRSKLSHLAVTYDCVQKLRKWRRLDSGLTELQNVVSALGCVNYLALTPSELEDLMQLLLEHFEEALTAIRQRAFNSSTLRSVSLWTNADENEVKPDVDIVDDLKPEAYRLHTHENERCKKPGK